MSSFKRLISAVALAISAPLCMLMPTFAFVRLGASFMPSPTKATFLPSFFSSSMIAALSVGKHSAYTLSSPSSRATSSALLLMSPLSITISFTPRFRSFATISLAFALISSFMAMTPTSSLSYPT